jgi:phosphate transport system permease protein
MTSTPIGIRERLAAAASGRIARVKRLDRLATVLITLGGVAVVASVSFIFVFILGEAWPLFRPARGELVAELRLEPPAAAPVIGTDEYQMYLYEVLPDGRVVFRRMKDGSIAKVVPFPGLEGLRVTAMSRSRSGDFLAAGTRDGRVALAQVRFRPVYEEQRLADLELDLRGRGLLEIDPEGREVREVSYLEQDGTRAVAALVSDDEIAVARIDEDEGLDWRGVLRTRDSERIEHMRLGHPDTLVAATATGNLQHWVLDPEPHLTNVVHVSSMPLTALAWALGGTSILVGDQDGELSGWFRVRLEETDTELALVKAHTFRGQGSPVVAIAPSLRDKSFVTAGADGSIVLRHVTSERELLRFGPRRGTPSAVLMAARGDGILERTADGSVLRYAVRNPHPEVSWNALFGKVWYEGYSRPEYVWQSTGATNDFEPKLSLVPLIFGTIKATVYAMLFATPLAILGALYTSQFVHPWLRTRIKPVVEIMAALPSVVIGFIGGLWLASKVEVQIVPILLMILVLPAFGTAGVLLWDRLPRGVLRRLKPGTEVALILPLLVLGGWVAVQAGPALETALFGGDFKLWLHSALGVVYDQRNSVVVGIAMGFAVIPIIFTIAEDSFSSVPSHLTAASLALGASRWQTAIRVVLPTASPGVFSALMIGFGRAVGETMIVLMATGNTPLLDWSVFNGMRTLSANIAVEVPEAPKGGSLYRVLFLSGAVLFSMTFVVNTLAEVVRQRLREKYRAL